MKAAWDHVSVERAVLWLRQHQPQIGEPDAVLVDSLLSAVLGLPRDTDRVQDRLTTIASNVRGLERLSLRASVPQRTPQWYDARHNMITASDVAQAIGKGKFGSQRAFVARKADPKGAGASGAKCFAPPLRWGVKYEPVANDLYRNICGGGCRVYDFGLLQHPVVPFIGASPDGVTELGVMLEIKCPWRRTVVTTDEVPEHYMLQIQTQLEVCDLEECDFFEVQLREDKDSEFYEQLSAGDVDLGVGLVAELADGNFEYGPCIFPGVVVTPRHLEEFQDWERARLQVPGVRLDRWRCTHYNLVRVQRDRELWRRVLPQLEATWQQVLTARAEGGLPPPQRRPRGGSLFLYEQGCMFMDDDDNSGTTAGCMFIDDNVEPFTESAAPALLPGILGAAGSAPAACAGIPTTA